MRSALSLAALTGQAVEITDIRKNRPKPGLQTQHRTCVAALETITRGQSQHNEIGSGRVVFEPGPVHSGRYEFDIKTAGSCSLLLQCVLPPLLFADKPSSVRIIGGTDVPFAPPSLFLENIFGTALEKMGAAVSITLKRHGFYPKGGGVLDAFVQPVRELTPAAWETRGHSKAVSATIISAQMPAHVAEREKAVLQDAGITQIDVRTVEAKNPGNAVFLKTQYAQGAMGFDALGKIGKPAERVAHDALDAWHAFEKTPDAIEPHLLDQLVLYAAVAGGQSRFCVSQLSEHVKSNLQVVHEMLGTHHRFDGRMLKIHGKKPQADANGRTGFL